MMSKINTIKMHKVWIIVYMLFISISDRISMVCFKYCLLYLMFFSFPDWLVSNILKWLKYFFLFCRASLLTKQIVLYFNNIEDSEDSPEAILTDLSTSPIVWLKPECASSDPCPIMQPYLWELNFTVPYLTCKYFIKNFKT